MWFDSFRIRRVLLRQEQRNEERHKEQMAALKEFDLHLLSMKVLLQIISVRMDKLTDRK